MTAKSTNISIDEEVKSEATALFASIGLTLADGVNIFLRTAIQERGFPFPLQLPPSYPAVTVSKRIEAVRQLFELAAQNPIRTKNYTFDREATYDREIVR